MRRIVYLLILSSLTFSTGCGCYPYDITPSRPPEVRGWKTVREGGVDFTAEFLLKVGDKVQNNSFGIELLNINRPEKCYGYLAEWKAVSVVIRFYRVSDSKTLVERTFGMGNTLFHNEPIAEAPNKVAGISIARVNTKDGWVFFNLIG